MITYCPSQQQLVDSRSDEGSSGCNQNLNNLRKNKILYFGEFVFM